MGIDDPWGICTSRADDAGKALADVLLQRVHGARPVVLVGFSFGARVVFRCLEELAARGPNNLGLISDAFIIGGPFDVYQESWQRVRPVVAGKLVNAYSTKDWLLSTVHRTANMAN